MKNRGYFSFLKKCLELPKSNRTEDCIHKQRQHHRNADAAFFDTSFVKNLRFDDASRRSVRVSVEAERFLDNAHSADALIECERDLVTLTTEAPSASMRVGYSIVTDGTTWYFLKIHWVCEVMAWKRNIQISAPSSATKLKEDGGIDLAKWLVYVVQQSAKNPDEKTGFSLDCLVLLKGHASTRVCNVESVLGDSGRFLTMCCTMTDGNGGAKKIVVKRMNTYSDKIADGADQNARNAAYLKNEIETLQDLTGGGNTARLVQQVSPVATQWVIHPEFDGVNGTI